MLYYKRKKLLPSYWKLWRANCIVQFPRQPVPYQTTTKTIHKSMTNKRQEAGEHCRGRVQICPQTDDYK